MGKMGKMMLAIALSLPVGVLAQEPVPPGQQQDQAINSTINPAIDVAPVGSGNVTDTNTAVDVKTTIIKNEADIPVRSAYAPSMYGGPDCAMFSGAVTAAKISISFGGVAQLRSCLARQLAYMLNDFGMEAEGKAIMVSEFGKWQEKEPRKKKRYVCNLPVSEHCTLIEAVDPEEPGQ